MERCRQCDPQGSEESAQRAHSSLDRIINQSVRVLTDRLFEHIRVSKALERFLSVLHFMKIPTITKRINYIYNCDLLSFSLSLTNWSRENG